MLENEDVMEDDIESSADVNLASIKKELVGGEAFEELDDDDDDDLDYDEKEKHDIKKRKCGSKLRSKVRDHHAKKRLKVVCNYCGKVFQCIPKKNGTSTLRAHLKSCKKIPLNARNNPMKYQAQLTSEGVRQDEATNKKMENLSLWKFDQDAIRKALAYMIVVDGLPFKFVEALGFRHLCAQMQPHFQVPSRTTVARDCYTIFVDERMKVKNFLKSNCRRVCLTTDTWTSLQGINYICLTAHFIDNDWKLQKRILNFCPISSHRGEAIGKIIEQCLLEWGIEKVMTITVDNASSNDVAISYLKKKIINWRGIVLNGEFLHMRCVAHIINLAVNDSLKLVADSITRIRNVVRYVRQSPARFKKFKACVELERIKNSSVLCLDVPTSWNSTYLMLDVAYKLRRAFDRFIDDDPFFRGDLLHGDGLGIPKEDDWKKVNVLLKLLECFYDLTMHVSGSLYVTSNTYFDEISNVCCILKQWCDDLSFNSMASKMMEKFESYWGNPEKINMLMFIAVVLDPRYKYEYVEFGIHQIYEAEKAKIVNAKLKKALCGLFEEYKDLNTQVDELLHNCSQSKSSNLITALNALPEKRKSMMHERFKNYKAKFASEVRKTELDRYLEERVEGHDDENFDILIFWKNSVNKYPILSLMARDVLAIPISTAASKLAFSTGGRVLDPFRSSLTPRIVEALICVQDWLRTCPLGGMEESEEELEKLEKDLSEMNLALQVVDVHR
ncbi:hypothetical protein Ancab_039952 [Ancistrocladus abbreviatus]